MSVVKNRDTPENDAFWKHVEKCAAEVATWPKWMGGKGEPRKEETMSHPLETISTSSRMLAEELATIYQRQDGHYQRTASMAALIDAWVRVREAEISALVVKWRKGLPTEPFSMRPTDHVYSICADQLETALATARKQLEEKVK